MIDAPCPGCGRMPGPYLVLNGWRPCYCGGHAWRECVPETDGCGTVVFVPPLREQCKTERDRAAGR